MGFSLTCSPPPPRPQRPRESEMKPQKMFAAVQDGLMLSVCYFAKFCRQKVGLSYAEYSEEWGAGWERALKAGVRIVPVVVMPAPSAPSAAQANLCECGDLRSTDMLTMAREICTKEAIESCGEKEFDSWADYYNRADADNNTSLQLVIRALSALPLLAQGVLNDSARIDFIEANVSAIRDIGWLHGSLRDCIDRALASAPSATLK